MTTVFLFAGQGSQAPGMGEELAAACEGCRRTFEIAGAAADFPLFETMVGGPAETLRQTAVAQPALLALAVAQAEHLRAKGIEPAALAGHSLGQYAALVVSGALAFADAVRLVRRRGELMQSTVAEGEGAMTAIVDAERDAVEAACARARSAGVVVIACLNAPGHIVISGHAAAVAAAAECCEEDGAGILELAVSAPFHSPLLEPMVPAFARLVEETPVCDPRIPVIDNVTAEPLESAAAVRRSLVAQVVAPVLFDESLRHLVSAGSRRFIQCGPGKGLLGFTRRVDASVQTQTFEAALAMGGEGRHVGPLHG